jgi:hypothetical protein
MPQPLQKLYLLYHELRPSRSSYSYVLETSQFDRQMDLVVRLRQSGASLLPEITFDDGHISNHEFAWPALEARGIKAWFFITVGWTGRRAGYMGWQELRELHKSGQSIGAHGWTHTLLTHCSGESLRKELSGARLMLEDKLGAPVTTMSLPGGRYNRRVLAACAEAGYTHVFTSAPKAESEPAGTTVGRLNIRGDMTLEWIEDLFQRDSGVLSGLERQYRVKATAKALLGDRIYGKVWSILNRQEPENDLEGAAGNEDSAHYQ